MNNLLPLLALALAPLASSFSITSTSKSSTANLGGTARLVCQTDDYFEFCIWRHEQQSVNCEFEWKYSHEEVKKQRCSPQLVQRLTFKGDYERHECAVELKDVGVRDAGQWSCEMESYTLGPIRGTVVKKIVSLAVRSDSPGIDDGLLEPTTQASNNVTSTTTTYSDVINDVPDDVTNETSSDVTNGSDFAGRSAFSPDYDSKDSFPSDDYDLPGNSNNVNNATSDNDDDDDDRDVAFVVSLPDDDDSVGGGGMPFYAVAVLSCCGLVLVLLLLASASIVVYRRQKKDGLEEEWREHKDKQERILELSDILDNVGGMEAEMEVAEAAGEATEGKRMTYKGSRSLSFDNEGSRVASQISREG